MPEGANRTRARTSAAHRDSAAIAGTPRAIRGLIRRHTSGDRGKLIRMNAPSDYALLHRFFFYGWLFRDASAGTFLERAAALAYNREQSKWLPTYLVRWLVMAGVLLSAGTFCETTLGSTALSVPFYLLTTITVAFNAVTAACWGLLQTSGTRWSPRS
jgi:hypothetical protein